MRGHPRGEGQVGRAQPHCYDFLARPKAESSDVVITSIISVCHRDASMLFDPHSTYSYVSSYFVSHLCMPRDSLDVPISVSTTNGDSIVS